MLVLLRANRIQSFPVYGELRWDVNQAVLTARDIFLQQVTASTMISKIGVALALGLEDVDPEWKPMYVQPVDTNIRTSEARASISTTATIDEYEGEEGDALLSSSTLSKAPEWRLLYVNTPWRVELLDATATANPSG